MDLIIGLGDVGSALRGLLEESHRPVSGTDKDERKSFGASSRRGSVDVMHICIPYMGDFDNQVLNYVRTYFPRAIVIHGTVKPGTTQRITEALSANSAKTHTIVFYSPIRGVHQRMLSDLKRYTKFYASYDTDDSEFLQCFRHDCNLKVKRITSPIALELAKPLVDTTYYGWMIVFWQLVDKACSKLHLDIKEVSEFTDEIQEYLGNRPKMYVDRNGIGGHCVLPNLELIESILPEAKRIITMINEETKKRYQTAE
jgi:hypothetical protein